MGFSPLLHSGIIAVSFYLPIVLKFSSDHHSIWAPHKHYLYKNPSEVKKYYHLCSIAEELWHMENERHIPCHTESLWQRLRTAFELRFPETQYLNHKTILLQQGVCGRVSVSSDSSSATVGLAFLAVLLGGWYWGELWLKLKAALPLQYPSRWWHEHCMPIPIFVGHSCPF